MRKLSFVILVTIAALIVSSCQPPKPGGEVAPSKSFGGQIEEPTIQKPDSSVERSVEGKNLKDSVLEGKK